MNLIDIHTHNQRAYKKSILNVIVGKDAIPEDRDYSLGIHPWSVEEGELLLQDMERALKKEDKHLVFIGECGIDRIKGGAMRSQEELFESQVFLSEKYHKPLMIHCVKAYNEVIHIKKKLNPTQPWVVHGFNRKGTIAKTLLENGFYLSFGYNFLKTQNGVEVLKNTPISKVFFETDDNLSVTIEEVYNLASEILQINIKTLIKKIEKNVCQVTGWKEPNY